MAEKVARLGVARDDDHLYYIKEGAVWRIARRKPGVEGTGAEKVADAGIEMDLDYIYFLDRDGDISRAPRAAPAAPATGKARTGKSAGEGKKKGGAKPAAAGSGAAAPSGLPQPLPFDGLPPRRGTDED